MMQNAFVADPKFVQSLVDTIKDTVDSVDIDLRPDEILLTSESSEVMRRMQVLADMISDHMRQWFNLQRNVLSGFDPRFGMSLHVEEFAIPQARMGSAIGPKGININAARKVDGVEQVNSNDRLLVSTGVQLFQIKARTPEAAKEAREILERNSLTVKVPRMMVGRVIGSQGSNIQMIVDKSGANRVSIDTESPERDGCPDTIYFVFHGMGTPLIDAKTMVMLVLNHVKRMDQVRKECLGGEGGGGSNSVTGNERGGPGGKGGVGPVRRVIGGGPRR